MNPGSKSEKIKSVEKVKRFSKKSIPGYYISIYCWTMQEFSRVRKKDFIVSNGKLLNPIENRFSVLKQNVRQEKPKYTKGMKTFRVSKKQLDSVKCTNMFKKSFGLTDAIGDSHLA